MRVHVDKMPSHPLFCPYSKWVDHPEVGVWVCERDGEPCDMDGKECRSLIELSDPQEVKQDAAH